MTAKLNSKILKNPLILSMDVDTQREALEIADELSSIVGGFKLGPRLCLRYGMDFVKEICKRGPVFLDNKHFDIPSTMEAAVCASFEAGASLVTVHALSGFEALQRMAKVEEELNKERPFRILCVTILTSWDQESLPENFKDQKISQHVCDLVQLAKKSGLTGVVCSPHELDLLQSPDLYLVTPGIRFNMVSADDQKRVMGPAEAIAKGASGLVVGRPILEAKNRIQAAQEFVMAINEKK